jgi:hypothetical protein
LAPWKTDGIGSISERSASQHCQALEKIAKT